MFSTFRVGMPGLDIGTTYGDSFPVWGSASRKAIRQLAILLEAHHLALGRRGADPFFFAQIPMPSPLSPSPPPTTNFRAHSDPNNPKTESSRCFQRALPSNQRAEPASFRHTEFKGISPHGTTILFFLATGTTL